MESATTGDEALPTVGQTDFALFESLYPQLRRFAAVVADMDVEPDDLVQDALTATLSRHELQELDKPAAYLKRTIVNVASNNRRKAGRLRLLLPKLRDEAQAADNYPSDLSILDELAPLDRAVIYLSDVDGLPHDVIARELDMTPAAVRKRASRARAQLRQALGTNVTPIQGGTP